MFKTSKKKKKETKQKQASSCKMLLLTKLNDTRQPAGLMEPKTIRRPKTHCVGPCRCSPVRSGP